MNKSIRQNVIAARWSVVLLATLAFSALSASAADILRNGDTVAVCGDSITEQRLYSMYIETYLLACKPRRDLKADQFGWSGEVAPQFLARITTDVLPLHPTIATTCYGMNDGHYTAMSTQTGDTYRNAMRAALAALKNGGVRTVVVGGPGCVDSETFHRSGVSAEEYNKTLGDLSAIARDLAKQDHLPFADVHGEMMKVMAEAKSRYGKNFAFAGNDGVHPLQAGHLVMAYSFLKAMGCDGNIGTITLDMAGGQNQNTATDGHHVLWAKDNAVEIVSTRFPFCFFGDGKSANSDRSVASLFPFNPELNRFMLVVKNLGPGRVRVTWGNQSKDYSADELGKGINLAAEFMDNNPFSAAVAEVEHAVAAQQIFETMLTKSLLHNAQEMKKNSPDAAADVAAFVDSAIKLDDALRATAARKASAPVHHVIKIELLATPTTEQTP